MRYKRIATTVAIAIMMLGMTSLLMGRAAAAPPVLADFFELDGDATGGGGGLPDEWDDVYAGTHNGVAAVFQADIFPDSDDMIFTTGGSKDDLDISNWHWTAGSPPDKNELTNAYAAAYIENGELRVYFGADLFANNGDAQIGFWFFQDEVGLNSDGSFSGKHVVGDVVVLSDFTNGGRISNIEVYEWNPADPAAINGTLVPLAIGVDCQTHTAETLVCATVNNEVVPAPWPYTPKSGTAETFPLGTFFEGGINLSEMLGQDLGCFSSFLAETRSSQSVDAVLKDFALGAFDVCSLQVTKDGDERSKVGDPANYTITIENTGSYPIYPQSIDDTLLGDLLDSQNPYVDSSTCFIGEALSAGQACTIVAARTVRADDPDPLPNTVTAVFSGNADGSGGVLDGSDYHEVNLFQPGILVTKSGDVHTAQIGDDITYQVTIENTSSADSPALVFDLIDDTLQGDLTLAANYQSSTCGASLAAGGTCTITYVRAIQTGDPSPIVNWVYVESHPDGFPNDIDGQDSHSVTLGDARISIAADATNRVDDEHTFTVTVEMYLDGVWAPAAGASVDAVATGVGGITGGTCETGTTDTNGQCTVHVNSSVPGQTAVSASTSLNVGSAVISVSTAVPAVKTWVDAQIAITGNATNQVGEEHTFTVTVKANYGDPDVWVPAAGVTVSASAAGVGGITSGTCQTDVTDADGQCTVLVNSSIPGQTTINASSDLTLDGVAVSVSTPDPGTKIWVDARISIQADAVNQVGDPHTFTVKVEKNESDGWVAAEGINPAITFPNGAPGTVDAADCEVTGTNADGTCLVTINSSVSGVFAVHASADIPAGGLTLHRETDGQGGNSSDAVKTYMTPNISIIKTAGDAADGEVYNIPFSAEPLLVAYRFLVTNSGDTYLSDLTITDDNGTPDDASDDVTLTSVECAGLAGPLAPDGTVNCTADLWVAGDETNIAVATGNPTDENGADLPGMDDPTDQDDAIVDMEVAPEVAIDKRLVDMDVDAEWPNYVTFTIAIENVGPSTIDILPLEDEYDPWYLSFVSADPMPEESLDEGLVNWYDLTFAGPNGFGVNLAHGEVFTLTTVFMIMHDITSTTNLAIVRDAIDVYENTAPEVQDDETIIGVPTAVELLYFRAAPTSNGILLEWETAMELNNWGFNLYRGLTPDLASAEWIQFEPGLGWGQFDGRQYQYLDLCVDPGQTVYYWLADIDLNNATNLLSGPVMTMLTPHRIFLPMVFG
jgi:uncharacterized repeat protein (TIGR01451 family)